MNEPHRTIDLLPLIFVVGSFLTLFVSTIYSELGAKGKSRGPDDTPPPLYFKVARVVASLFLSLTIAIAWYHQDTRPSGSRVIGGTLYIAIVSREPGETSPSVLNTLVIGLRDTSHITFGTWA